MVLNPVIADGYPVPKREGPSIQKLGTLVGFDGRVKSCRLGDKLWQHVLAQRHNFCPSARYCSEHVYCVAFSDQLKYVDCCDLLTAAVCETEDIMADMLQIKSR
jgi:hypothetical protein